jgi:hypothetical protein
MMGDVLGWGDGVVERWIFNTPALHYSNGLSSQKVATLCMPARDHFSGGSFAL